MIICDFEVLIKLPFNVERSSNGDLEVATILLVRASYNKHVIIVRTDILTYYCSMYVPKSRVLLVRVAVQ